LEGIVRKTYSLFYFLLACSKRQSRFTWKNEEENVGVKLGGKVGPKLHDTQPLKWRQTCMAAFPVAWHH